MKSAFPSHMDCSAVLWAKLLKIIFQIHTFKPRCVEWMWKGQGQGQGEEASDPATVTHVPGQQIDEQLLAKPNAHETIIIINKLVLLHVRSESTNGTEQGVGVRVVPGVGVGVVALMSAKIKHEKCYEFSYN